MITIQLNKLNFFSHHGVHEEEGTLGAAFEINAAVSFREDSNITSLEQTIDYTEIYSIIMKHMNSPYQLLETVAMETAENIYQFDKRIQTINISISKLHPPINNFTGSVGVTYHKEFL